MDGQTDARTDNVKTVYPLQTKFAGGIIILFKQKCINLVSAYKMCHNMRFPTMWFVWPAKAQISLRICAVWSEPLLVAYIIEPVHEIYNNVTFWHV